MKVTSIIIFAILPVFIIAQQKAINPIIGVQGMDIRSRASDPQYQFLVDSNNETYKSGLGWMAGFQYNLQLHEKIFLYSGLVLVNHSRMTHLQKDFMWPSQADSGVWNPTLPAGEEGFKRLRFIHNYMYVDVPLYVRYVFQKPSNTIRPFVEIGVNNQVYLMSSTRTVKNYRSEINYRRDESIHTYNLLAGAVLGINIKYDKGHVFFVQSAFQYQINRLFESETLQGKLYTLGIHTGIRMSMKG